MIDRLRGLSGKLLGNARLLRSDPERLGRNLVQFTNPALFEERLVDIHNAAPMHVRIVADTGRPPTLNVLDAAWAASIMTGGPNTVINLTCRVAQHGIPVRFISTVQTVIPDLAWFRSHAESLLGHGDFPDTPIITAGDPARPLELGPGDLFLATHWSTAQQLKAVLPSLPHRQFFYMLQDFEPGFYAWSSNYALAIETYGLDFHPIVNEPTLADYLFDQKLGRLSDPAIRARAAVFDPAVDATLFYPGPAAGGDRPKRLLFYARPKSSRNMFGLGLTALRQAAANPVFAGWEFLSLGDRGSLPDVALGGGRTLLRTPWQDYAGYADTLRSADILLCPMLSPHTSYPVLEMAACGGLAVTNSFATKTRAVLEALSGNIVAVEPTVEGLTEGLCAAAGRINAGHSREALLNMPRDWAAALDPVARQVAATFRSILTAPCHPPATALVGDPTSP